MKALEIISESKARDCYNATRPDGAKFWHELARDEQLRLIGFARMVSAVDRSWLEREAKGKAARELRTRFLVLFNKINEALAACERGEL